MVAEMMDIFLVTLFRWHAIQLGMLGSKVIMRLWQLNSWIETLL